MEIFDKRIGITAYCEILMHRKVQSFFLQSCYNYGNKACLLYDAYHKSIQHPIIDAVMKIFVSKPDVTIPADVWL